MTHNHQADAPQCNILLAEIKIIKKNNIRNGCEHPTENQPAQPSLSNNFCVAWIPISEFLALAMRLGKPHTTPAIWVFLRAGWVLRCDAGEQSDVDEMGLYRVGPGLSYDVIKTHAFWQSIAQQVLEPIHSNGVWRSHILAIGPMEYTRWLLPNSTINRLYVCSSAWPDIKRELFNGSLIEISPFGDGGTSERRWWDVAECYGTGSQQNSTLSLEPSNRGLVALI